MNRLNQTVNRAVSAGILLGGACIALVFWYLSYTQAKVDAFTEFGGTGQYTDQ